MLYILLLTHPKKHLGLGLVFWLFGWITSENAQQGCVGSIHSNNHMEHSRIDHDLPQIPIIIIGKLSAYTGRKPQSYYNHYRDRAGKDYARLCFGGSA